MTYYSETSANTINDTEQHTRLQLVKGCPHHGRKRKCLLSPVNLEKIFEVWTRNIMLNINGGSATIE